MAYQFDFVPVLANTDLLLRSADQHGRAVVEQAVGL